MHSGKGKVTADGVVGIARAFLGAVLFLTRPLNDGSAGMALHLTTKCLRESEKYSKVTHWAPFVLFSDDVTLEFATEKEERRKETLPRKTQI